MPESLKIALPAAAVLALALTLASSVSPCAAADNMELKMALHVEPHGTRSCGQNMPTLSGRADLIRMWETYADVDVFVVVFSYDSLTSLQYALTWPEEWGSGITEHCGDLAVGGIEQPGDWLAMYWQDCQRKNSRPAYWPVAWTRLSPVSDGEVAVSSHQLLTVDCSFNETEPESIFNAGLNVNPYEGPPGGGVAVEPSTWGALKAMFK